MNELQSKMADDELLNLIIDSSNAMKSMIKNKPKFISSREYSKLCLELTNLYSNYQTILLKMKTDTYEDVSKTDYINTNMCILMTYAPILYSAKYDELYSKS